MNLKALHNISYGIYVLASKSGDKINAQIANSAIQVTSEPARILVSVNKQNLTHEFIQKSGYFSLSVLSQDATMKFIGNFGFKSGRDVNKFENINYNTGKSGVPVVTDYAVCYIEAKVVSTFDVGTHTLFIGEVIDADVIGHGEPMTYAYYHKIKKGSVPKTAPHYIKEEPAKKEVGKMKKYRCKICGYVYEPDKGDPDGGIKPGTAFEDIPDDWVCPVCGAAKSDFEEVES